MSHNTIGLLPPYKLASDCHEQDDAVLCHCLDADLLATLPAQRSRIVRLTAALHRHSSLKGMRCRMNAAGTGGFKIFSPSYSCQLNTSYWNTPAYHQRPALYTSLPPDMALSARSERELSDTLTLSEA